MPRRWKRRALPCTGPTLGTMYCLTRFVPLCAILLLLAACGGPEPQPEPEVEGPLVSKVIPSAATLAKFAAADRMDGTEDKVISLCASCGLRMSGKPEFSCKIGDYTAHCCAKHCMEAVCADPDKVFAKIEPKK